MKLTTEQHREQGLTCASLGSPLPLRGAGRRGPKALDKTEKRTHCVSVRLNAGELKTLDEQRGKRERGAWLRQAWAGSLPPPVAPELNRLAWAELARAAANLNQIARQLNTDDAPDLDKVRAELAAFRAALIGAQI